MPPLPHSIPIDAAPGQLKEFDAHMAAAFGIPPQNAPIMGQEHGPPSPSDGPQPLEPMPPRPGPRSAMPVVERFPPLW